jgi:hypothetical protein
VNRFKDSNREFSDGVGRNHRKRQLLWSDIFLYFNTLRGHLPAAALCGMTSKLNIRKTAELAQYALRKH